MNNDDDEKGESRHRAAEERINSTHALAPITYRRRRRRGPDGDGHDDTLSWSLSKSSLRPLIV